MSTELNDFASFKIFKGQIVNKNYTIQNKKIQIYKLKMNPYCEISTVKIYFMAIICWN